jgi:DNA repair ATPase RecN
MKLLTQEERITELAQMLSGENITPEAIQNARVLLNQ